MYFTLLYRNLHHYVENTYVFPIAQLAEPPSTPKVSKLQFFVTIDVQCSETYAKHFSDFVQFFRLTKFVFQVPGTTDSATRSLGQGQILTYTYYLKFIEAFLTA